MKAEDAAAGALACLTSPDGGRRAAAHRLRNPRASLLLGRRRRRPPRPRQLPVHARRAQGWLPAAGLDDASVRRLLVRRGDQHPLPAAAGSGADRSVGGVRPAHPAGPRLRPPAGPRRGRSHRCGDRLDRGHAAADGRDPARRRLDVDDHQRARLAAAAALRAGGRGAGRRRGAAVRHDPERHPQGVHRPRQLHLPGPAQHAADRGHVPLLHRAPAALEHDLDLGLPHPGGGLDGRPGAGLHHRQRHRLRAGGGGRGPRGGCVRAAAVLLLQRAQRLLPGGRQVPRRPHAVGRADARALRQPGTSAA